MYKCLHSQAAVDQELFYFKTDCQTREDIVQTMLDLSRLHVDVLTVGIVYQTMFGLQNLYIYMYLNISLTVVTLQPT